MNNKIENILIKDKKVFEEICLKLDEVGYVKLASNTSLTEEMINIIFEKNIPNANINLLRNSKCPKIKLDFYIKEDDKVYNIAMAHNENLDEHQFNKLYHHRDFDVNISLAQNINTPIKILKQLVILNNKYINEALCTNVNIPINTLRQFQYDEQLKPILLKNKTFKEFIDNEYKI